MKGRWHHRRDKLVRELSNTDESGKPTRLSKVMRLIKEINIARMRYIKKRRDNILESEDV
jgi:hypothetical protein